MQLTSQAGRRETVQALALRARIVLSCANGQQNEEVAASLGVDPSAVGKWRRRFQSQRLDGLNDAPRSGTPRSIDDTRHGTTSLFAALDVATGTVIDKCHLRHQVTEFRRFLDEIEAHVPADLDVHLVWDNYATHKTAVIRNWLAKRPRRHVYLTLTSSSWP